jgi:predicted nucleic acid-binding protein
MKSQTPTKVRVVDEVWIATALLHREHPEAPDFLIEEIVDGARREGLHQPLRPGVYVHVVLHCVANRPPNPGRYRMLYETVAYYQKLIATTATVFPFEEKAALAYARLRADRSLRPPDAIQLACAATAGTDLFITNDVRLHSKQIPGIQFIVPLDRVPI